MINFPVIRLFTQGFHNFARQYNYIVYYSPGKLAFDPEKSGEQMKLLPYICMDMTMLVSKIPTLGTSGIFLIGV